MAMIYLHLPQKSFSLKIHLTLSKVYLEKHIGLSRLAILPVSERSVQKKEAWHIIDGHNAVKVFPQSLY
jgi:hypothetical protein